MIRKLLPGVVCLLIFASTATAQTDFREALRLAFPATVSVEMTGANDAVANADVDGDGGVDVRLFRRQVVGGIPVINDFDAIPSQAGFAVGADLILTQIPSDVDEVTIKTVDGTESKGKVVVRDHVTGLTIVKIDGTQFVSLVVGEGFAEAGLPVVATHLDEAGTARATLGMIASGLSTAESQLGFTQHVSPDLNRTATGAPIIDASGVVVGVVGVGEQGAMVCLPTQRVVALINQSAEESPSDSKRGLIGIQFARDEAPVVTAVTTGSAADDAGLKARDEILRVGDYQITSSHDVLAAVAMARAGDDLSISVQRGDETFDLVVELGEHPRQQFVMSGRGTSGAVGRVARQAWQLRDGKLVPLDRDNAFGAPMELEKELGRIFKNLPDNRLILPGLPNRLEGFRIERSELEDSLQKLESEKKDQADQIEDLQKKLRELQDKMKES